MHHSFNKFELGTKRVVNGIILPVRVVRVIRVVKQWFTSRAVGELDIILRLRVYYKWYDPYES